MARAELDEAYGRALARAEATGRLEGALVAELAPGATSVQALLGLVAVAEAGEVGEVLVEVVERDRMPVTALGLDLTAAALWAAWRLGDREALRARILRAARLRVRGTFGDAAAPLVVDLGKGLGDAEMRDRVRKLSAPGDAAIVERAGALFGRSVADVVAGLPAEEPNRAAHGFTVRVAARPGRNEPCPCGSGKKYKKCCADKDDAAAAASPVAGMSWDEYLTTGAAQLTPDDIDALALRDLARVDLARLGAGAWASALRRFIAFRRWDLAARLVEGRADAADVDDWRGELEAARRQVARVRDPDAITEADQLQLALRDRPGDALALLEEAAGKALRTEETSPTLGVELAYGVLPVAPALGILLARANLATAHPLDIEILLETAEDARIGLDLPEGDPGWELWSGLDEEAEAAPAKRADDGDRARLTGALSSAQKRAADLERQLQGLKKQLQAPAPAAAPAAAEPAERRALRERIETLEARIREGNEERLGLRRQLAAAAGEARRGDEPAPDARDEADDDGDGDGEGDGEEVVAAPRGVLVPRFARAAEDALGEVPAHVAAETVRTVGQLAAGDAMAWSRVKQAKDLRPPLLMARIGIHHRVLFRVEEGRAEILELVTRESLMHALRRLRRS